MKKNTMKLMLGVVVAIAAAVVIQACTESQGKTNTIPKANEPIPVKIIQPSKATGITSFKLSGQVSTDDEAVLAFKTGGVVEKVLVKEGDRVKKGQVLATLDLTEIEAQVSQARLAYEKAQRDFGRMGKLYRDSVITLEQFENTETARNIAKEQLDAALFNKNFSSIHALADGFVLKKFVNAGQVVGVGDPILKTNGAAKGQWILKVGVSDKQWAVIQVKQKATVQFDAFPERTFNAQVTHKSETSDSQTGAFTVEFKIEDEGVKFATGMFAMALINIGEGEDTWKIPYEAVLDANGNVGFVFVTTDQKTAVKKAVSISSFDGSSVHISKGLEGGEALIVTGSAYLTDQSAITVVK
ncbi:efflux RND transporter periplasmic adaptor subunit [Pseudochryseolinea flava]|uniref:Efflux RND transporter periplasmic adaptor subunit n=1 Tax=Pseudochryseolinea flava TaxID=2059302 RepID=A0A364XVW0_9BACT|nr:efflux RND transporter periplasmic adaptor subunit [Pseudochryseolinea flava]RAV98474.1 efflux RND transporter periplasmic adaptor subunit [Pseudochryseolinea flava]